MSKMKAFFLASLLTASGLAGAAVPLDYPVTETNWDDRAGAVCKGAFYLLDSNRVWSAKDLKAFVEGKPATKTVANKTIGLVAYDDEKLIEGRVRFVSNGSQIKLYAASAGFRQNDGRNLNIREVTPGAMVSGTWLHEDLLGYQSSFTGKVGYVVVQEENLYDESRISRHDNPADVPPGNPDGTRKITFGAFSQGTLTVCAGENKCESKPVLQSLACQNPEPWHYTPPQDGADGEEDCDFTGCY